MPLDATSVADILTSETLERLRGYFAHQGHRPSPEHWMAIEDVARTLSAMANGTADAKVYLSPLDPGVGKSSTVTEFAGALARSPLHQDVGMIVCVGRINEAISIATAIRQNEPGARVAVLTAERDTNEDHSTAAPNDAQILITTQQRVTMATHRKNFGECDFLFYQGHPRAVRAWEEAWLPGVPATASKFELLSLSDLLARHSPALAEAVIEFANCWSTFEDGQSVPVPDFERDYGVSFHAIMAQNRKAGLSQALASLSALTGRVARVRSDGLRGMRVLQYQDTLPADFGPLLVLDASGRVRETYRFIESHRGGFEFLRSAVKNYGPLTVKVWQRSGSKSGWETGGSEMTKAVIETIREKPTEAWLVVAHKPARGVPAIEGRIKHALPRTDVRFMTWGQHMASNDHSEVPNVILAGTLFMPSSYYTALTHLAQDRDVAAGLAPSADVRAVERGEHADLLLQAICRGRVRKSDGDRCLPMTAYVIASRQSGIPSIIQSVFPGCRIETWREVIPKTPKKVRDALSYVQSRLKAGAVSVTNRELGDHLKTDRGNLRSQVLGHRAWARGLARMGVETYEGRSRTPGGVRRTVLA